MLLATHLQSLQTFIRSSWAKVPQVEQVVAVENGGLIDIITVISTNDRKICYDIYELERKLAAHFPDMLFDFDLALDRYEGQSLSTSKAWIAYDRAGERGHARPS